VDEEDGLQGLAIFDIGNLDTLDTPQVIGNLDPAVVAKTLGVGEDTVRNEWYTGKREVLTYPWSGWSNDSVAEAESAGERMALDFKLSGLFENLKPQPRAGIHGDVRTASFSNDQMPLLRESNSISLAYTEIAPGAMLEPYWVDNGDEVFFVIEGDQLRVGRADMNGGLSGEFQVGKGHLFLNEVGLTTFVENTGTTPVKLLRIFNVADPSVSTLYDAYIGLPTDVAATMFHVNNVDQTGLVSEQRKTTEQEDLPSLQFGGRALRG